MNKIYKKFLALTLVTLGYANVDAQITYNQDFESGLGGWSTNWANTTTNSCVGSSPRRNIYTR